jgi:hypothetical protein
VDTRIGRVADGDFDATILASSGLRRLKGQSYPISEIDPSVLLLAPGQGILALELRKGDAAIRELISPLRHMPSELALIAERAFMLWIRAGCQTPAAAFARISEDGKSLVMDALVAELDGSCVIEAAGEATLSVAVEADSYASQSSSVSLASYPSRSSHATHLSSSSPRAPGSMAWLLDSPWEATDSMSAARLGKRLALELMLNGGDEIVQRAEREAY